MSSLFVDTSGWASLFVNTQPYYPQAEQYFRLAVQQQKIIYRTHLTSFTPVRYSYGKSHIQQPCRTLAA